MDILSFIEQKRDGGVHSPRDMGEFVRRFAAGEVPDYQAAAWLMAVYFNGLNDGELRDFTLALARSGDILSFGDDVFITDKHSTGGVGDKVTLILVPLAAACGVTVAKLSGRGLGFTGGTADKLEAIPGFRMHLTSGEFMEQVRSLGCAISGHSADLAPAEAGFYALRDVSGTVPSLPLICSSIVSKKLAGGADGFVFDVKCGRGAFMTDYKGAEALAEALVSLSRSLGKKAAALITDMDQPLGRWIGNGVEVLEAVEVLRGGGPRDVREVTLALVGAMISLSRDVSMKEGRDRAEKKLDDGSALALFRRLVEAQGGDGRVCEAPGDILPIAPSSLLLRSEKRGRITGVDAKSIGEGVKRLGGGRMSLDEEIDLSVGVRLLAKTGDPAEAGEPLLEVRYGDEGRLSDSLPFFEKAFTVEEDSGSGPKDRKRGFILGTIQ
ncbi:MAG: thymidine phosphorylase [Aminivibrio sp.]